MNATPTAAPLPVTDLAPGAEEFLEDLLHGLEQTPRRIPCKYLYDERGARLFEQICELPEYYPTRAEREILERHADAIATSGGPACRVVELGSGSGDKIRFILDQLKEPAAYLPIDISRPQLLEVAERVARDYPGLDVLPVCADFSRPLALPPTRRSFRRTLLFYPGSTIGNFHPPEARAFLAQLARASQPGDRLVLGVDLEKHESLLLPAYNDDAGVTAAFNLNLLHRANRELGADFDPEEFRHEAIYDRRHQRIEMHLVSRRDQELHVAGRGFFFAAGERIVTEYSYKPSREQFTRLCLAAGWSLDRLLNDEAGRFAVFVLALPPRRQPLEPAP